MRIISRVVLCLVVGLSCLTAPTFISSQPAMIYQVEITQLMFRDDIPSIVAIPIIIGGVGTAFAVSDDGDLLTARHVADPDNKTSEFCALGPIITSVTIWLKVTDVHGRCWRGRATTEPASDVSCDAFGHRPLHWDPDSTAWVAATADTADVGLICIKADHIPRARLNPSAKMHSGEFITMVGWPPKLPAGTLIASTGFVSNGCALMLDRFGSGEVYEPVSITTVQAIPGMSGAPVLQEGDLLAGIAIAIEDDGSRSFAIPGSYAAQWYNWVRGRSTQKPSPHCPQ